MPVLVLMSDSLSFLFQSKGTSATTRSVDRPSNQIPFSSSTGNVRRKILSTEDAIICLHFVCFETLVIESWVTLTTMHHDIGFRVLVKLLFFERGAL